MIRYLLDADGLVVRPLRPREYAARVTPPGGSVATSRSHLSPGDRLPDLLELPTGATDHGPIYLSPSDEDLLREAAGASSIRAWIATVLEDVPPDVPIATGRPGSRASPLHAFATPRAWGIVGEIADRRGCYRQDVVRGALLLAAARRAIPPAT